MPIDPDFQKKRKKIGKEESIAIWGPLNPPKELGIRGTYVAVDSRVHYCMILMNSTLFNQLMKMISG